MLLQSHTQIEITQASKTTTSFLVTRVMKVQKQTTFNFMMIREIAHKKSEQTDEYDDDGAIWENP